MIRSFDDKGSEDIFNGVDSRRRWKALPASLSMIARRKLDQLNQAARPSDPKVPPKNRLEALKRDRAGQHAIGINDHYQGVLCVEGLRS